MIRRMSATMFLLVMTLVITLKHPVLGYCLCLDTYFAGDCVCLDSTCASEAKPSCSSSCCAEKTSPNSETPNPTPCDDCNEQLQIDTGDFVWNSSDCLQLPEHTELSSSLPNYLVLMPEGTRRPQASIRGDPPPDIAHYPALPTYLRHSVLRL